MLEDVRFLWVWGLGCSRSGRFGMGSLGSVWDGFARVGSARRRLAGLGFRGLGSARRDDVASCREAGMRGAGVCVEHCEVSSNGRR